MVSKSSRARFGRGTIFLGCCYLEGYGVKKNKAEAAKWQQKAMEQVDKIVQGDWILLAGLSLKGQQKRQVLNRARSRIVD